VRSTTLDPRWTPPSRSAPRRGAAAPSPTRTSSCSPPSPATANRCNAVVAEQLPGPVGLHTSITNQDDVVVLDGSAPMWTELLPDGVADVHNGVYNG
jgi:hypothetical protein